ncbi:hypothetical protein TSOC_000298 [Tetrabaena socialis]|uniref:Uncharacterized protein n=1 Tax=Tetrabaena socialis TaxID=47790 RepID=A0A2J8AJP3_9CHLO|nr:hypothetical protein TSOC_000298 [Tetrabaena socialis]|eukprot:PNH12729.1 hypothetical protein TSOC_000298 [Tetrabaena socialis]
MAPTNAQQDEDVGMERAPWDSALAVDVTSVPVHVVLKNCLSDSLNDRLQYIRGLAAASTRASKRELVQLLEVLTTLLEDEALGVRLGTLQQMEQLGEQVLAIL